MGSGKTGQHGATETFHPGPWEVSRVFPAAYGRQSPRTGTGQTQTACYLSEVRPLIMDLASPPVCPFFLF